MRGTALAVLGAVGAGWLLVAPRVDRNRWARAVTIDPNKPCSYCCGTNPCGSEDPAHDGSACPECYAVELSEPHPECLDAAYAYSLKAREPW